MSKHKQSASLGDLRNYIEPQKQSPEERIDTLERRVKTLEMLLNDVMMQLDKPYQSKKTNAKSNGKPESKSSSKPNPKAKSAAKTQTAPKKPKKPNNQALEKRNTKDSPDAEIKALEPLFAPVKALFADGVKRTEEQIREALPELSKKKFRKLRHHFLVDDGNENRDERLYFIDKS